MAELYGPDDQIPAEIADVIIDEPVPVGETADEGTADTDPDEDVDEQDGDQ